ncbi:MAG: hypothetical protein M5U25_03980 [Planctomycetota bacterium]|nr:hypothetical protein [Planctomycetota bacterium]
MIAMEARYYRNVFETTSTSSTIRPLLIVKRVRGLRDEAGGSDWIYGLLGMIGIVLLMSVLTWFILSERRERARFEASTLELSRSRLKKQGGLKLKPLPGAKGGEPGGQAGSGPREACCRRRPRRRQAIVVFFRRASLTPWK